MCAEPAPPPCRVSAFNLGSQSGIAIGPILFIVALLAVIAAAISAGSDSFSGDTSAVSAKAKASAILEYADSVKMGVDRVLGRGCTDTQISFENPIVSGYTNANAPADKSCHVFDQNGGGIVWKTPQSSAQSQADYELALTHSPFGGVTGIGNYGYASNCVMGVGTGGRYPQGGNSSDFPCYYVDGSTSADLVMFLPWITKDECLQINNMTGFKNRNPTTPPTTSGPNGFYLYGSGHQFFDGTYYTGSANNGGIPTDSLYGNPIENLGALQGCFDNTSNIGVSPGGGYYYFRVLHIR
ncbi:MAG: hypothetical protein IPI58_01535 [Alphaproteobacteria bacterium]|nr:MAG: hypothetical protein IPI58_01535 [Alphaproteobacteria bacterium]